MTPLTKNTLVAVTAGGEGVGDDGGCGGELEAGKDGRRTLKKVVLESGSSPP